MSKSSGIGLWFSGIFSSWLFNSHLVQTFQELHCQDLAPITLLKPYMPDSSPKKHITISESDYTWCVRLFAKHIIFYLILIFKDISFNSFGTKFKEACELRLSFQPTSSFSWQLSQYSFPTFIERMILRLFSIPL